MANEIVQQLADAKRAYLIAPAGCGKTQVIAQAVALNTQKRQLVLTHTHAGVHSLRSRLKQLGVAGNKFHIDTIAGWALQYATAFPSLSGLTESTPTGETWNMVYAAMVELLRRRVAQSVVVASYSGVYVDEYQDCIVPQHQLVMALAEILPCRILGDPMQGIFGFQQGEPLVDWDKDISPNFAPLSELNIPWRWEKSNQQLGKWLIDLRQRIRDGKPIDLRTGPIRWLPQSPENQRKACFELAKNANESIVAIHYWAYQCHNLAQKLGGSYTSMEEMDCKDLLEWSSKIEQSKGPDRAVHLIDFSAKCMTVVISELRTIRNRLAKGNLPDISKYVKHQSIIVTLLAVAASNDLSLITPALQAIEEISGRVIYRKELWMEMKRALRSHATSEIPSLRETAWQLRNRYRQFGRRMELRTVSRTLLIKGLEFNHAIVLDADKLDSKNLYVAMTRGAKSLTVLSKNPVIQPPSNLSAKSLA